jgi:uncharacterized caspase-like protein
MLQVIRITALICCLGAGLNAYPAQANRMALVIGNANHHHLPALKNPINDATDVAEALAKLDFKVTLRKDAGFGDMLTALRDLSRATKDAEVAVVYFAGNGIELNGRNYLIPVDARLTAPGDAEKEAVSLDTVIGQLAEAKLALIILDACRDNPFLTGRLRGSQHRGLTKIKLHNAFIVYSAGPGKVAEDGRGRNSPFTAALLKHLATPGQELRHLAVRVRADVIAATGDRQVPAYFDNFNGEFTLKPAQ